MDAEPPPFLLRAMRRLPLPCKLGVLERIWHRHLARRGICWTTTASGLPWKLDLSNPTHRWLVYGDYQGPDLRNWARRQLPPGATLIVSGANIGQMIASLHPTLCFGAIHAFEPDHEAQEWLASCLAENPGIPATLHPCGLGATAGSVPWIHSDWSNTHGAQSRIDPTGSETIPLVRLDEVLPPHGGRIDLWILDVEGHEAEALTGAQKWLQHQAIRAVFMEVDDCAASRHACALLEQSGYRPFGLQRNGRLRPNTPTDTHGNRLFLAKNAFH